MKIVERYIGQNVIAATLTVLLVLLAIFSFFAFIDELEDIGRGGYSLGRALLVVILSTPGLAYELFPVAALLGALIGLGQMMERNEIAVVRCAGVSQARLTWSVMKIGFVFVVIAMLIGELLFPPAEREANDMRALTVVEHVSNSADNGFWARDGNRYINIREVVGEEEFRTINILEFDDRQQLRVATHAESANFVDKRWLLRGIAQTRFDADGITSQHLDQANWDSMIDPEIIGMIAIKPETLSLLALLRYVEFAQRNGQNAQRWELALWTKLAYPFTTAVMVFLAIPLVLRNASRSITTGRRILTGALIGLGFHVLNQASGHLGVVFGVSAAVSALGPAVLLFGVGLLMHFRLR